MPPINNAELVRRTEHPNDTIADIRSAHACFQGVQRRYDQDDSGSDVYVYVINSAYTVRWQSNMRTCAGIYPTTAGTVLTVQVRSATSLHPCQEGIWGTITKWEFISADRDRPEFPEEYDRRYDGLIWPQ